jgi:Cu+-exporting ATPase
MAKDPVCNMQVDPQRAAGRSSYQGADYYFCSASCKTQFDRNPARFVVR